MHALCGYVYTESRGCSSFFLCSSRSLPGLYAKGCRFKVDGAVGSIQEGISNTRGRGDHHLS